MENNTPTPVTQLNQNTTPVVDSVPTPQVMQNEPPSGGGSKKLILMVVIILVILALVAGGYYAYSNYKNLLPGAATQTTANPNPIAADQLNNELNSVGPDDVDSQFAQIDKDLQSL